MYNNYMSRKNKTTLIALALICLPAYSQAKALIVSSNSFSHGDLMQEVIDAQDQGVLTGLDANKNGIRDDVDALIAALPDSIDQKRALNQLARSFNRIIEVGSKEAPGALVSEVAEQTNRALGCMNSLYHKKLSARVTLIGEITFNTPQRVAASNAYAEKAESVKVSLSQTLGCE